MKRAKNIVAKLGSRYPLRYLLPVLLFFLIFTSCQNESTLFQRLSPAKTGINFRNEITEDSIHNILNFTNLYTGSGVGIGDFNRDGKPDIFFGGNMESSRLYLNEGDFKFQDITEAAGVKTDRWITGVTIVDINSDGWDDIYLCVSGNAREENKRNLLFINDGLAPPSPLKGGSTTENLKDSISKPQNHRAQNSPFKGSGGVTFTERAAEYGIDDPAQSTHANFFDYDKDGDLDLFLIVNPTDYTLYNVNTIRRKKVNGEAKSTDKLYQNNQIKNESNSPFRGSGGKAPSFTDVSKESGILIEGYSLSLNTSDLNNDGYPDIYITNDFLSNDIIYINNQDGTFTNRAAEMLKHTSFASMGCDVADINNDGEPEIYVLDMMPEDNYRQKMIMGSDNYDRFQYMLKMGYEPQYSRNTLQWNNGDGTFSEIGQMANVHKTDWSWSALFADYDNDGFKDLYVTNGFRRDLGDLDYINYTNTNPFGDSESRKKGQLERIKKQPGAQLPNYIFMNETGLTFSKKSAEWGVAEPSYSHGAAFADLDGDGDLDLVTNNVSQEAFVYENRAEESLGNNYLRVDFRRGADVADTLEVSAKSGLIGTKVWLYYEDKMQFAEYTPYRGYQSSVEQSLHFGLGKIAEIDSLKMLFPDGKMVIQTNIKANQSLNFTSLQDLGSLAAKTTRSDVEHKLPRSWRPVKLVEYLHQEDLQVDFKTQSLLPHQHSKSGPKIAVADINNDGLEDAFIGGAAGYSGIFFIQKKDGTFTQKELNQDIEKEDTDCLFFDFDKDGDLDLYIVSGGVVFSQNDSIYQDRIYLNENGNFTKNATILPKLTASGGCVAACDFDADGDVDLFIGGRVTPTKYPTLPESYLLENQRDRFVKITPEKLRKIGMVTTVIWEDIDNDNDQDLVLAGEFMPITVFKNEDGKIQNLPLTTHRSKGWWNTLRAGDFDNDGDVDFLAGNLGLNSNYKASPEEPVCIYAKDFDENGAIDPILCQYIDGVEYPVPSRDKLIGQIPPIKNRFNTYRKYAAAAFSEVLKKPEREGIQVLEAEIFASCFVENLGNGDFKLRPLPLEMQIAPLNDFLVEDFDGDGNLDALAVGNSYATEVSIGRYDAGTGALLLGNGKGEFTVNRGAECGFLANKDAKSLVKMKDKNGESIILVGNNSDSLQVFQQEAKRITNNE